jgi:hypothetical protein
VESIQGWRLLVCIRTTDDVLGGKLQNLSDRNPENEYQTHPDNEFPNGHPPRHSSGVLGDEPWLRSALLDGVEQGDM